MRSALDISFRYKRSILVFILYFIVSSNLLAQEKFSKEELTEDLSFIHEKYHKSHPNLYRYISEIELDSVFLELENGISDSMTEIDFYNRIRCLSAAIKDGHTSITLSKETLSNQFREVKFPFEIKKMGDSFIILDNYSADSLIKRGDHLLEINGELINDIYEIILNRQTRDGENKTFPEWSVQNWFMAKYGLNFGYPKEFKIKLKNEQGLTYDKTIQAITVDSMRVRYKDYYSKKYIKPPSGRGIYLHKLNDSIHVLRIKTFSSSMLRKRYEQSFRKSIREIFKEINNAKPKHLLIDLRGNLGGESTNGNYLLSYLVNKPYDIVESTDMVRRKNGRSDRVIKNRGLRFRIRMAKKWNKSVYQGQSYLMINGGSFSCSGIVASNLERYTNCQFIGQETGGNATRMSGAGDTHKLPNTKIRIKIPVTRYTIRPENELTSHGVLPDYEITLNKDQLISYEDEELKMAIQWILNH